MLNKLYRNVVNQTITGFCDLKSQFTCFTVYQFLVDWLELYKYRILIGFKLNDVYKANLFKFFLFLNSNFYVNVCG